MTASADFVFDAVQCSVGHTGGDLRLRQAHQNDRAFLYAVFESTRASEFSQAGWSAERVASLLAEQFSMQDTYYRRVYPRGRFDVVMRGEMAIGRLYHDWHGSEACLIDIALLPVYRRAGIGTRIVRAFVAQAAQRSMPVQLYVEANNPVQGLYRRLGFEATGENGVYLQMRRPAVPFEQGSVMNIEGLVIERAM
ncbi:GNAT family N-acetyltransferase [Paraburkholderia tagetis]|uniref:GNAT family N-acetyltransferase n=1 Tax=Paraburkholderia tagetis TaxID=2913261 RepID=A0A9X1RIR1_9BURK|nr:GNAT family N-acetyltransferase [Paraburkholderia tagetis]MCG5073231.1 GNAT family N-acetyltransferase [Paraburkholderia tagetis]